MKAMHIGLVGLVMLCGCLSSAQKFVDEKSGGYFVVKGSVKSVDGLSTTEWEQLSDGLRVVVAPPGCTVTVEQEVKDGDAKMTTSFQLVKGDHILLAQDKDFVLSSLQQKSGSSGTPAPPPADSGDSGGDGDGDAGDGGDSGDDG